MIGTRSFVSYEMIFELDKIGSYKKTQQSSMIKIKVWFMAVVRDPKQFFVTAISASAVYAVKKAFCYS